MTQTSDKVVLITGASSGLGAEIARAFAKQGAALSITGRNKDNLSKVSKECKEFGAVNVVEIVADLSEKVGIEKVVKETTEIYDKLDVLVNNAGLFYGGNTETMSFENFNKMFDVNLRSPFFLTQLCIPYLAKAKGNIVNISSNLSQMHQPLTIGYSLTKASLDHFTKTTALELSAKGIRVNSVNPGVVRTRIFENSLSPDELDHHLKRIATSTPLGKRITTVDEIADAVIFLSSDAAKMVTGVCIVVDGGRVLH